MAQKKTPIPVYEPFKIGNAVNPEWVQFFQQFMLKAETQTDAVAVSDPPTKAEVDAIVTVINALIDKLQVAGQME